MCRRRIIGVLAGILVARGAAADPEPRPPPEPGPYTSSIVISDAVSAALLVGGYVWILHSDPNTEDFGGGYLMMFGAGGYLYVPGFIHHDVGHDGRGVLSGVLRAALPLAAGLAVNELTPRNDLLAGAVLAGAGVAMVIDWVVIARPPREPTRHAPRLTGFAAPTRAGAIAGLAGSF